MGKFSSEEIVEKLKKLLVHYFGKEIFLNRRIQISLPDQLYFRDSSGQRILLGNFREKEEGILSLYLFVTEGHNVEYDKFLNKAFKTKVFNRISKLKKIIDNYFIEDYSTLYFTTRINSQDEISYLQECFNIHYLINETEYTIDFVNEYYNNKKFFDESFLCFFEELTGVELNREFSLKDIVGYGKMYKLMLY